MQNTTPYYDVMSDVNVVIVKTFFSFLFFYEKKM